MEAKEIFFVVRVDEKGPPDGPFLDRNLAHQVARAHPLNTYVLRLVAESEMVINSDD